MLEWEVNKFSVPDTSKFSTALLYALSTFLIAAIYMSDEILYLGSLLI